MLGILLPTIKTSGSSSTASCFSVSVRKCGDVIPQSNCTPSTISTNVSSVSDYGTGHYAPTYVTSMANTNYGVYACGSFNSSNRDRHVSGRVQNAGSAECLSQAGSTATDNVDCYVLVFGD